jgi:hypothetical protein
VIGFPRTSQHPVRHRCAAGVYQALCGACPALSALLDKSPGTTLQAAGCVELLSFAVLQLWRSCARISPGPIIVGSAGSTVAPIVQLSEAVLRRWPGTGPVAAGNSSSRMRRRESATRAAAGVHLDGRELLRDAANEVMCLTDKLAFCLFDEVRGNGAGGRGGVGCSKRNNLMSTSQVVPV